MKTFKDLKIGDTMFEVAGRQIRTIIVNSLNSNYAVICDGYGKYIEAGIKWSDIKDETSAKMYGGCIMFCNQSEAILTVKERLKMDIDEQAKIVYNETQKLLKLKDEMYKYL